MSADAAKTSVCLGHVPKCFWKWRTAPQYFPRGGSSQINMRQGVANGCLVFGNSVGMVACSKDRLRTKSRRLKLVITKSLREMTKLISIDYNQPVSVYHSSWKEACVEPNSSRVCPPWREFELQTSRLAAQRSSSIIGAYPFYLANNRSGCQTAT